MSTRGGARSADGRDGDGTRPVSARRISVRLRLTLVYGSLFFAAGAILVLVNYFFVERVISQTVLAAKPGTVFGTGGPVIRIPADAGTVRAVAMTKEMYRENIMTSMFQWSLAAVVIVGCVGLAIGWIVARRVLAPLHRMTETARRLSESTLHRRIALDGPHDELRELADTFDSMLERLGRAFDSQRRFVANASHELRTPLAIDRALLQVSMTDPELPGRSGGSAPSCWSPTPASGG
nr:hypothetical protein GCM10020093_044410 [Planobispora longispora]